LPSKKALVALQFEVPFLIAVVLIGGSCVLDMQETLLALGKDITPLGLWGPYYLVGQKLG